MCAEGCDEFVCQENETYIAFAPGVLSEGSIAGTVASLVLLSDAGAGAGGANLADALNIVGYELDDTSHQTNVVAAMVVPNSFATPPIVIDLCVGPLESSEGVSCLGLPGCACTDGSALARVGMGPIVSADSDLLNENTITTLRAFVVNRIAPHFLFDLNGDRVIDAGDAELAGFRLLSREVTFRVRTSYGRLFDDALRGPLADLDGNGSAFCCADGIVCRLLPEGCGAGGGQLTPVPR
jgi:hypothetical protein